MSELKTSAPEISIRLVGPGLSERDFHLPEGSTLADLLDRSGASTQDQAILVDGQPLAELLPLRPGMVITVVPRPKDDGLAEPWRGTIPAFQDEALFREYTEILTEAKSRVS